MGLVKIIVAIVHENRYLDSTVKKATLLSAAAIAGLYLTASAQAQDVTVFTPNALVGTGVSGLIESVYHSLPGSAESPSSIAGYLDAATPNYSFTNTNDGFTYGTSSNTPTNTFLGADAAGAALTDTAGVGDTAIDAEGYIVVTAADVAAETSGGFVTPYFTFTLMNTDDYAAIYVGGTGTPGSGSLVTSADVFGTSSSSATVDFVTPGLYTVEYLYYNGYGGADLNLTATDPLGDSLTYNAVPEPSMWALMLGGVAGLMVVSRRRAIRA
jgi:hypothetical protein